MRRKSPRYLFLGWFMLLGMLFHVLVAHHDGAAELLLESGLRHAHHHDQHEHAEVAHHAHPIPEHDSDRDAPAHSHHQLGVEHPDAYTCPSSTEAQDLLALRLISLLASLPVWRDAPQTRLKLASLWEIPEPQPPPEQIRLALTTTILLI